MKVILILLISGFVLGKSEKSLIVYISFLPRTNCFHLIFDCNVIQYFFPEIVYNVDTCSGFSRKISNLKGKQI